ncbi:rRNA maturation RNase YbeY [Candidatus Tachikawaea gelatinosa]|uniref:Endoribonuclease YbeY n=1 Tax=Candidatus Tachikawaea gelatinosa TaxID=1410383 RepID=A0A090AQA2_9ENTR|nr:rRNA maturation RNase YbeY [Candidatus Tachikawaea gelatinosa]BAP58527.1 probable rRNA maturation factor [Candidatus Tachikawaea gelatinosa]
MKNLVLNIQIACSTPKYLPKKKDIYNWINATIPSLKYKKSITLRVVNKKESSELNFKYRGKKNPTNILSFSFLETNLNHIPLIGDLVICAEILENEAYYQKKKIKEHWAHIIIHGTLHLFGYDHVSNHQKKIMENLEKKIMMSLGYCNPYF